MAHTSISSQANQWHILAERLYMVSMVGCLDGLVTDGFETLAVTVFSIQRTRQDVVLPNRLNALVPQKALKHLCHQKLRCNRDVREHRTRPDGPRCRAGNFLDYDYDERW